MAVLWTCTSNAPTISSTQSMEYFFIPVPKLKKFRGIQRTTIVTTLENDIKNTLVKFPTFQIKSLNSLSDLENICKIAQNRQLWRKITKAIMDTVQANSSL